MDAPVGPNLPVEVIIYQCLFLNPTPFLYLLFFFEYA